MWFRYMFISSSLKTAGGNCFPLSLCLPPETAPRLTPKHILWSVCSRGFVLRIVLTKFLLPHSPVRCPPHRKIDLYCSYKQWSSPPGKLSHLEGQKETDRVVSKFKNDTARPPERESKTNIYIKHQAVTVEAMIKADKFINDRKCIIGGERRKINMRIRGKEMIKEGGCQCIIMWQSEMNKRMMMREEERIQQGWEESREDRQRRQGGMKEEFRTTYDLVGWILFCSHCVQCAFTLNAV